MKLYNDICKFQNTVFSIDLLIVSYLFGKMYPCHQNVTQYNIIQLHKYNIYMAGSRPDLSGKVFDRVQWV